MLSYAHTGLYYVYYIVAEFLAFLDDIHIHGTDGVGIEMVVYIVDVLALQLIAIVVDFVLDVEREVGIVVSLMTYEGDVHHPGMREARRLRGERSRGPHGCKTA